MTKNTSILVIIIFLAIGVFSGCSKKYDPENPIVGVWVFDKQESVSNENIVSFRRASKFDKDKPGYQILENGSLVSHQNSGDCGTPPIHYEEAPGSWTKNNDNLQVNGNYWGGTFTIQYEINRINAKELELKLVSSQYNLNK